MNKQGFHDIVGEWPENVIGSDWENEMEEFLGQNTCVCGGYIGGFGKNNIVCNLCKMD